jgi:prevent-host-death family protein
VVSVLEHDEVHCGGLAVAKFSITDAKTRFSELIQKAIAGEEVIIAKDNKPVVKVSDRDTRQKTRTGIRQRTNLDGGGFRCDPRGFQELQLMRVLARYARLPLVAAPARRSGPR